MAGIGGVTPWEEVHGQCLLGRAEFMAALKPLLAGQADVKEIPKSHRFASRPNLGTVLLVTRQVPAERDQAIRRAHLEYGYSLTAIGQHLGVHYTTVSKIINRGREHD